MEWQAIFHWVFARAQIGIVLYVASINLVYFALRRDPGRPGRAETDALIQSSLLPSISVIAPAYNEARSIRESVRSFLSLDYPSLTVIVVNDGSTDDTLAALIEEFRLYRSSRTPSDALASEPIQAVYESRDPISLIVVDKENGGKSDALNAGLRVARSKLVAAVDADSLLESGSLFTVVRPFLEDDSTVATGGIVRVVNGCRVRHGRVEEVSTPSRALTLFQTVEYLRAFLGGRVAFSFMNALLLISGAFGLFRRSAVVEVGGFSRETVGEDMELVLRLHHLARREGRPYRIVFVPDPVCWTDGYTDHQVEFDMYPRFRPGTYAYVSGAFAPEPLLFPKYRVGFDLYQSLGNGYEGSGGFRQMQFANAVTIYVGSLTKYRGNWMYTSRVFVTPNSLGPSISVHAIARRYRPDGLGYWGVRYGRGAYRDEVRTLADIAELSSDTFAGEWFVPFGTLELSVSGSASREGRAGLSDLWQFSVSTGLGVRF